MARQLDYREFVTQGLGDEGLFSLCILLDLPQSGPASDQKRRVLDALARRKNPDRNLRALIRDYLDARELREICRRLELPVGGGVTELKKRILETIDSRGNTSAGSELDRDPEGGRSRPGVGRTGSLTARAVAELSEEIDATLSLIPGKKGDKFHWLENRLGVDAISSTSSYTEAWSSVAENVGAVAAAKAVFALLFERATPRVQEALSAAQRGDLIEHQRNDPAIMAHLFAEEGHPSEVGALVIQFAQSGCRRVGGGQDDRNTSESGASITAVTPIVSEGASSERRARQADAFGTDLFLELFKEELLGPKTPSEVRRLDGPHVYFVHCREQFKYNEGYSRVAYIGFTESPRTRFSDHSKVHEQDALFVLPLTKYLRALKENFEDWRRLEERQKRTIHESAERLFLYLFRRIMGSIPRRNTRRDIPTKEAALVGELLFECQQRRFSARRRSEELSEIIQRLETIRRLDRDA